MLAEVAAAAQDYLSDPSTLGSQVTAAAISSWVIQLAKKSTWPWLKWIDANSTIVTRCVSAGFAILSTAGISMFWHGNGDSIAAGGTFALVLADGWIAGFRASAWKTVQSFVWQQLVYQVAIKHDKGQTAADVVADKVAENKEVLAATVVDEARKDPNSMLKLKDDARVKEILAEHRTKPEEKPFEWDGP